MFVLLLEDTEQVEGEQGSVLDFAFWGGIRSCMEECSAVMR